MPSFLDTILKTKQAEVDALKASTDLDALKEAAEKASPPRGFAKALQNKAKEKQIAVIAELKRASPSKGLIRPNFDVAAIAADYAKNGAACLSVLTDKQYFQGDNEFLRETRAACNIPVLRKDFIIDDWQIYEARAIGADAILLIAAALDDKTMQHLENTAMSLGLDVLVEVHNETELQRALKLKTPLLGINNRDLHTFNVDINKTIALKNLVPENKTVICESGVVNRADIERLATNHVYGFLIGETLMRAQKPGEALAELCAFWRG